MDNYEYFFILEDVVVSNIGFENCENIGEVQRMSKDQDVVMGVMVIGGCRSSF